MAISHGKNSVTSGGNPFTHQRDFHRGIAYCDVSTNSVIRVSGPDRLVWLNSLISQEILSLTPGQTQEGLILDPTGHIEHVFLLADDSESTWLMTEHDRGAALATWLASMKFRMEVEISDESGQHLLVAISGGVDSPILGSLNSLGHPMVAWDDPWPTIGPGSIGYAHEPHPGIGWSLHYLLYPRGMSAAVAALPQVDAGVIEALGIAAGRPMLVDVDQKSLPHESDWLRTAVHMNKGCYRGQETVAKVHNLGHPPRRLTLLHLDGSQSLMPVGGDVVMVGEKEVGVVTRAAWHFELGPIALAMIKRNVDTEATLQVVSKDGSLSANQEILVPPEAGAARAIPRIPRLGHKA